MSDIQEFKHPNQKVAGKVEALSASGYNQKAICQYLKMDEKTLRKHYRHELDVAMMERTMKVAERLYTIAMNPNKDNHVACMFWLKCQSRGGWIEANEELEELAQKGVNKIQIEVIGSEDKEQEVKVENKDEDDVTVQ
jgi:abortive infection bacteriophage resistance protein